MDHSAILSRIKKLMQVTTERGASEAEAEQAARRVREALDQHNLSMFDIPDDQEKLVVTGPDQPSHRKWMISVAYAVGKLYDCQIAKSPKSFCFVGARLDVEVCREVYQSLLLQIHQRGVVYLGKNKHDYFQGMAIGLKDRIFTIVRERERQTVSAITALVVQKHGAIDQWVKQQGYSKTNQNMQYRTSAATFAGIADSGKLQISRAVE